MKFLQGLTTKDLSHLDPALPSTRPLGTAEPAESRSGGGGGVYTAFLTNKGKVAFDAFIVPHTAAATDGVATEATSSFEPDVLLDCHVSQKDAILKHLKRYKLRAKVNIRDVSDDYSVWAVLPSLPAGQQPANGEADVFNVGDDDVAVGGGGVVLHTMSDPRLPALGQRVVLAASDAAASVDAEDSLDWFSGEGGELLDLASYAANRMALGVAEGPELVARMPLECNLDALNAVSFDKGCYVGQELVARTHYKGQIRKRVMPFTISAADDNDDNDDNENVLAQLGLDNPDLAGTKLQRREPAAEPTTAGEGETGDPGVRKRRGAVPAKLVALETTHSVGLAMVRLEALPTAADDDDAAAAVAASTSTSGSSAAVDEEQQQQQQQQQERHQGEVLALTLTVPPPSSDKGCARALPVSVHLPSWWPQDYLPEPLAE